MLEQLFAGELITVAQALAIFYGVVGADFIFGQLMIEESLSDQLSEEPPPQIQ